MTDCAIWLKMREEFFNDEDIFVPGVYTLEHRM